VDPATYVCAQFPGMESCPASLHHWWGEDELGQQVEMHARLAHDADLPQWPDLGPRASKRNLLGQLDGLEPS
jgi:hypothetical protein